MITVFYAWQSDRDEKICRYFIRDALADAIKEINAEYKNENLANLQEADAFSEVVLDYDTKGVPGIPKIADVIERKIAECNVFIADVTHVTNYTTADNRPKQTQNGNVLIELGQALARHPAENLLLVMNSAFGAGGTLPFDLHLHRHPLAFDLPDDTEPAKLKAQRQKLAKSLKFALKLMVDEIVAKQDKEIKKADEQLFEQRRSNAQDVRKTFDESILKGQFQMFTGENYPITTLCLYPLRPLKTLLDLGNFEDDLAGLIPYSGIAWDHRHDPEHFSRFVVPVPPVRVSTSIAVARNDGTVFAADVIPRVQGNWYKEAVVHLAWENQELRTVRKVGQYLAMLRDLGVAGPVVVALSLFHVEGVVLFSEQSNWLEGSPRHTERDRIQPNTVEIPANMDGLDLQAIAKILKPIFDHIWRSSGARADPYYQANGDYVVKQK